MQKLIAKSSKLLKIAYIVNLKPLADKLIKYETDNYMKLIPDYYQRPPLLLLINFLYNIKYLLIMII